MSKRYRIHPAIGIARVGSSGGLIPDRNFFYGPEIPGTTPMPSNGSYRDAGGFLRHQAARFRVYEYDDDTGAPPTEVTVGGDVTKLRWTVHLANKKAFWYRFEGLKGESGGYAANHWFRNGNGLPDKIRRRHFIIDPGPRVVDAPDQTKEFRKGSSQGYPESWPDRLTNGQTFDIETLGAMLTDAQGRLTVLGGLGKSGTTESPQDLLDFANNPGWFDDTSDGPVEATVVLADGTEIPAAPAWVIVGPPDFAPGVENIVTLYDLLFDLGVREFTLEPRLYTGGDFARDYEPSFTAEVYPLLRRAIEFAGVSNSAGRHETFASPDAITALAAKPFVDQPDIPSPADIFSKLRAPKDWQKPHRDRLMPRLLGDEGRGTALTLTPTQFHIMRQWSKGLFLADWTSPPAPAVVITPHGLDRAALEACVGGAFFPGIEAGWIMRRASIYERPFNFRFKPKIDDEFDFDGLTPGSVTMRSAVPWQADFYKCDLEWWPAQRPNEIRRTAQGPPEQWARGISSHLQMVQSWDKLGIVKRDNTGVFIEEQRKL